MASLRVLPTRRLIHGLAVSLVLTGATLAQALDTGEAMPRKKLVEYGWDVPDPEYLRQHLAEMTARPFDGVVFRLREFDHAFDPRPWDAERVETQAAGLRDLDWGPFTDNFLVLHSANPWGMDWFDDGQWETIAGNLLLVAETARQAGCVGICFDPEPYGPSPWTDSLRTDAVGRERLRAQVRLRGGEFISALQEGLPGLRLLTLYQLNLFGDLGREPDPKRREQSLASHPYSLYPAFIDGMLDALGPETRLIDGNESSYYYDDSESYLRGFHSMRQTVLPLVSPSNRTTYRAQVDAGMALYVDQVLALRQPPTRYLSHYLDPADRLRWFEHNVYWALRSADEYVWCYSERMNWWTGEFPDGLDRAIRSAREKLARNGTADFQLAAALARGRTRMEEDLARRFPPRRAVVRSLEPGETAPVIDGSLTDGAWQGRILEPFVAPADAPAAPAAATTAWVASDSVALYVAIRCAEPRMAEVVAAGAGRDDALWVGDSVELLLSLGDPAEPYVHLILNPANRQWDGRSVGSDNDATWDAAWTSAVSRDESGWSAELALPWAAVGGPPAAGAKRRANLCRQRIPVGELSAWSPVAQGFLEPSRFGVWEFPGTP